MSTNRLHLNFSLDKAEDRTQFLNTYFEREEFKNKPLNEEELETCANYLLWGQDAEGKNSVQNKLVQIDTKNKTWDKKEDESLDNLMEQPSFNEAYFSKLTGASIRVPRENFSRAKALKDAPPSLIPIFKDLFTQIDRLDLMINFWDLAHNRRKNPPRQGLLSKFSQQEQDCMKEETTHWNQYKYLKMRHLLVELRRQQYTLKDSYSSTISRHTLPIYEQSPGAIQFDTEIQVFPLGVNSKSNKISPLIFRTEFIPDSYTEEELSYISTYLWNKISTPAPSTSLTIDFRNLEHVYNIFLLYFDLEDEALKKDIESETQSLLNTLKYYISMAKLTEVQKEILDLKMKKVKNQDIASYINKKFKKSYTANYISTIFRQKIIKQINDAAAFHVQNISNIFFPENFKRCTACGRMLLRDPENFVKKTRSKDGYSNRCKQCDKAERDRKKEKK